MNILIANDDGIYSPGLLALAKAAEPFGNVRIMAPDTERSSTGHAITSAKPLSLKKMKLEKFEAYRVDGTPADCVSLGCFYWNDIDVVLSGINLGPNIGNALWHSGTLAAAKQGTLLGKRAIALSTPSVEGKYHFSSIEPYVKKVLELVLSESSPKLVNVNFPAFPQGMQWTMQSVRSYDGKVVAAKDPMGREHFWYTVIPIEETDEGTDRWAMERDIVSMTPLRLDLTDKKLWKTLKHHEENKI